MIKKFFASSSDIMTNIIFILILFGIPTLLSFIWLPYHSVGGVFINIVIGVLVGFILSGVAGVLKDFYDENLSNESNQPDKKISWIVFLFVAGFFIWILYVLLTA